MEICSIPATSWRCGLKSGGKRQFNMTLDWWWSFLKIIHTEQLTLMIFVSKYMAKWRWRNRTKAKPLLKPDRPLARDYLCHIWECIQYSRYYIVGLTECATFVDLTECATFKYFSQRSESHDLLDIGQDKTSRHTSYEEAVAYSKVFS